MAVFQMNGIRMTELQHKVLCRGLFGVMTQSHLHNAHVNKYKCPNIPILGSKKVPF